MGGNLLVEKVAEVVRQVPESALADVISALESSDPELRFIDINLLVSWITQPTARALVTDLVCCWRDNASDVKPSALAWALKAAYCSDKHRQEMQKVELVWTGPSPLQSTMRRTDQVLLALIDNAKYSLIIVTFAAYKIPEIRSGLVRAAERGVRIQLIVESAEVSAGKIAYESLAALGKEVEELSGVFVWPLEKRPRDKDGHHGSLHVKCAVASSGITALQRKLSHYCVSK